MSVIVIIREKNIFYVAGDFIKEYNSTSLINVNKNNYPVWRDASNPDVLIGHSGRPRFLNILKSMSMFKELTYKIDITYMTDNVMIPIVKEMSNHERHDLKDGVVLSSSAVFIKKDKAFIVCNDGAIKEVEDMYIISSGDERDFYYGSLLANHHLKPRERIIKAFKLGNKHLSKSGLPIVMINTKTMKFEIIV